MNFYIGQIVVAKSGSYPPMWVHGINPETGRIETGHIVVTEENGIETATKVRTYWKPEELTILEKVAVIPEVPELKEPVRRVNSYRETLSLG